MSDFVWLVMTIFGIELHLTEDIVFYLGEVMAASAILLIGIRYARKYWR